MACRWVHVLLQHAAQHLRPGACEQLSAHRRALSVIVERAVVSVLAAQKAEIERQNAELRRLNS
jgi:hypothetical protein